MWHVFSNRIETICGIEPDLSYGPYDEVPREPEDYIQPPDLDQQTPKEYKEENTGGEKTVHTTFPKKKFLRICKFDTLNDVRAHVRDGPYMGEYAAFVVDAGMPLKALVGLYIPCGWFDSKENIEYAQPYGKVKVFMQDVGILELDAWKGTDVHVSPKEYLYVEDKKR